MDSENAAAGHEPTTHGASTTQPSTTQHGSDAHHAPAQLDSLVWPAANFALYVALMIYLFKRFLKPALISRATTFEQNMQKAAQILETAERELGRVETRLADLATEETALRTRLGSEGEHLAQRIVTQAEETAANFKKDVVRRVARELAQAKSEIRELVVKQATVKAREQLERGISAEQDRKLREDTLRRLTA
jgi:F0F1-type ATP synthase membrane subunit b/b'